MPTAEAIEKRIHRCVRVMCPPIPFSVKASRPRTASNLQAWHFPKFSSFVARKATTPKVLGISFYTFKHETFFYMALFSIKQHFFRVCVLVWQRASKVLKVLKVRSCEEYWTI